LEKTVAFAPRHPMAQREILETVVFPEAVESMAHLVTRVYLDQKVWWGNPVPMVFPDDKEFRVSRVWKRQKKIKSFPCPPLD
jgi:hypothetical protein